MVHNQKITVIINELQNQIIKNKAEAMGYKNKTDFARDMLLKEDLTAEEMLNKIHRVVCKETIN